MPCINCKLVTYYLKGCDFCSFTGNNLLNNLYTHFLIHIGRTYSKWRFLKHYEHMNSYILINKKFTRNPKTDIYITLLRLSPLEIQEFDAIGKNEHKLDNPAYMSNSNNRKSKPKFCLRNSFNPMLPAPGISNSAFLSPSCEVIRPYSVQETGEAQ